MDEFENPCLSQFRSINHLYMVIQAVIEFNIKKIRAVPYFYITVACLTCCGNIICIFLWVYGAFGLVFSVELDS